MIFLFILYNLFLHGNVLAGPIVPPFHQTFYPREIDPNKFTQRTEWNIISSCFATLFACSWVAIHPNIPPQSDSFIRILVRRLMMMGYMLIVPEMVIFWAARQWCGAYEITKRNEQRGWRRTHSFFAIMGGFVLCKDGVMTETLEIEKLERLALQGKIDWPNISTKEMKDRSKGDVFSKAFAVLQTTWFIIQCIARGVAGLNITLLEVATLAFAVLNGILYFLWWDKPLDVACPVPVHFHYSTTSDTALTTDSEYGGPLDHDVSQTLSDSSFITKWTHKSCDRELGSATKKLESESTASELISSTSFRHPSIFASFLGHCRNLREMVSFALFAITKPFRVFFSPVKQMAVCDSITIDGSPALSVPTFYAPEIPPTRRRVPAGIAMVVGIIFGGIHCIAWSFSFLSIEEANIWRFSAFTITAIPLTVPILAISISTELTKALASCLGCLHFDFVKYCFRYFFNFLGYINSWWGIFWLVMYFLARIALLILPLLAIRSLPSDSLLEIKWSTYIPHL